jgi:hypothetical protein
MNRDYGEFAPIMVYSYQMEQTCPYNDSVACEKTGRACDKCGWNPDNKQLIADRLWDAVEAHEQWLTSE